MAQLTAGGGDGPNRGPEPPFNGLSARFLLVLSPSDLAAKHPVWDQAPRARCVHAARTPLSAVASDPRRQGVLGLQPEPQIAPEGIAAGVAAVIDAQVANLASSHAPQGGFLPTNPPR